MERLLLPPWFRPHENLSYRGPTCLWLLLCVTSSPKAYTKDLVEVLDQIEPAIHGGWSEPDADLEDRSRVALAHCVAKSWGAPALEILRGVLEEAGVVDWQGFVTDVVRGAAVFHWQMATFQPKDRYRWVKVNDLPVTDRPHRLPLPLQNLWDEVAAEQIGWRRRRRDQTDVKDEWIRRLKERPDLTHGWELLRTDWSSATVEIRRFWELSPSEWTQRNAIAATEPTENPILLGARSLLVDPIVWFQGSPALGNGRHRVLALSLQGVSEVLISDR